MVIRALPRVLGVEAMELRSFSLNVGGVLFSNV